MDTWGLEYEIMQHLEQRRWDALTGTVRELWSRLEQHRMPQHRVKETASRIEQLCARISLLPSSEKPALYAADHERLKEALLTRLEEHYAHLYSVTVAKTDHPEVNKVLAYLHEHYDKEIKLSELAKLACMDDKYLSSLFKKKTGSSIIPYLQQIRIDRAKKLLRETNRAIGDIGESVGFANDNYFIKIFKRYTGHTPAGFRHKA